MGKLTIIDKLPQWVEGSFKALDRSLNRMVIDIERLSKQQVPVGKTGHLKASGSHKRIGFLRYQVEYNKEYAAYQEFGGDGVRVVKHYSLPGKKKFYLRDPGDLITSRALDYIKREASHIRI